MSCGKDETASLSKEDSEQAFTEVNTDVAAELSSFGTAPGFTAMNSLSTLNSEANPFGRIKSVKPSNVGVQVKTILNSFRSVLQSSVENGRVNGDVAFDFDGKKGVYTYNFSTQQFDYASGGNIVEINFPSEGSSSNNAVFKLTAYDEVMDSFGYYNATLVQATMTVDGTLEAEIDMSSSYDSYGETTKANIDLYMNPYTFILAFDNTGASNTTYAFSFLNGTTVIIDTAITVVYSDKASMAMSRITGYFQLMNIRFEADITENNQVVIIKVDGANAGTIVPDETTGEPYVQYNDGTSVPFETVFGDLALQLGNIG